MRTHLLKDLPIAGKSIVMELLPDFDLYRLGLVTRFSIEEDESSQLADIFLTATYSDSTRDFNVTISFSGCRRAKLPEFAPLFYLTELEIEDIRKDQLENIHYKAKCYGDTDFEILSNNISITKIERR
jgi:hypothetical protein